MIRTPRYWIRACLFAVAISSSPGLVASLNAALITVNTVVDVVNGFDGLCSLREAITASNNNVRSGPGAGECVAGSAFPGSDSIRFAVAGVITPAAANGALPTLVDGGLLINGWSAPGAGPGLRPRIVLNGAQIGFRNGIHIFSSSKNQIRGLAIVNFGDTGIVITGGGAVGNHVYGNAIGTNPAGTVAFPNSIGISISLGATENIIGTDGDGIRDLAERNLISGNTSSGIEIAGPTTQRNRVAGNRIGTNAQGAVALPNGVEGIRIHDSAANNIVGTDSSGDPFDALEGNLISGNGFYGISEIDANNVIAGNIIGLNAAGNAAIPNLFGIQVLDSAIGVRIGTDGDGISDNFERNVISGNTFTGIDMSGSDHLVAGNYIGTDVGGAVAIPNGEGIVANLPFFGVGANMTIGGPDKRFRNVISGNFNSGISIVATDVTVECNYIGTDAGGTLALGNDNGVRVPMGVNSGVNAVLRQNLMSFNRVGVESWQDTTVANDNIIAGNTDGFSWHGAGVVDITNNWWGDASGPTHPLNPGGVGDTVLEPGGGTTTFSPFLTAEPDLCAVP